MRPLKRHKPWPRFEYLYGIIFAVGLFCGSGVLANSLDEMESVLAQAKNLDDFLARPKLVQSYFTALKGYYGRDRFRCESYERILRQVKLLAAQVPGVKERLWEKIDARSFSAQIYLEADSSPLGRSDWADVTFRPIPRRFHGIWNDPSPSGCISNDCTKADNATPERWAIALKNSRLYLLEKNGIFNDVGILVLPVRKGKMTYALVSHNGPTSVLTKIITARRNAKTIALSTTVMRFWHAQMALDKPPEWSAFVALQHRTEDETNIREVTEKDSKRSPASAATAVVSNARELEIADPLAGEIEKAIPRNCFASKRPAATDLVLGIGGGENPTTGRTTTISTVAFPPLDSKLLQLENPKVLRDYLAGLAPGRASGWLQNLPSAELPPIQISLANILKSDPLPLIRARAATEMGALPPIPIAPIAVINAPGLVSPQLSLSNALKDSEPLVRDAAALGLHQQGITGPEIDRRVANVLNFNERNIASTDSAPNVAGEDSLSKRQLRDEAADRFLNGERMPESAKKDPRWTNAMIDRALKRVNDGEPVGEKSLDRLLNQLDNVKNPTERQELVRKITDVWSNNPDAKSTVDAFLHHIEHGSESRSTVEEILGEANKREGSCKKEKKEESAS